MIEQIKKDREDGFKGALHIDHDDNWLEGVNGAYVDGHYFSICVASTRDADRRRLIRLPELEEAYIAAIEALELIRDADNDCRADGLQTLPDFVRSMIDAAMAKAEGVAA